MPTRSFWVYIIGGAGKTIYIGVTNDIIRRVYEHKHKLIPGFTARYNLNKLLFYVEFSDPLEAIAFEKKIKGWVRRKKDALIDEINPELKDLAVDWY